MPFYEYQCTSCDHKLEVLQKISDTPLICCPSCNETTLKKLISAVAFRLKGSGWYETDFKNDVKKSKESPEDALQNKNKKSEKSVNEEPSKSAAGDTVGKPESGGKTTTTDSTVSTSATA